MTANPEVIKSAVRWVITTFGALLAGWFAHSGYITANQVTDILNSPVFMSLAVSAVTGIIGLFVHTQANAVKIVDEIAKDPTSPVVGVVTANTPAGKALADAMPGHTTAAANSVAASAIAQDNIPPLAAKAS